MEIELTPEQRSFVHLAIEQGRIQSAEDAVKDALTLWEERERARAELIAEIDAGEDSFEGGAILPDSEESIAKWIDGVKQRGRAKLAGS
jgi:putative addiction module CopG family antidote